MKVYLVKRTCYGEDYPEPSTQVDVFATREGAKNYFDELLKEEAEYMGMSMDELMDELDLGVDDALDYIDPYNDYRVVLEITEKEVK